jgi:NitT/TauT family transport system permease protein
MTRPGPSLAMRVVPPIALFLLVLGLWQATTYVWNIPRFELPSPLNIFDAARSNWLKLTKATAVTGAGAACGFIASVFCGTLVAMLFSQSSLIRRSFVPYAIFLQTVPIVAVAPLIILWAGTGFRSVVIVAFIVSVFPVVTNATAGLTAIDPDLVDLFRLHGASRWQTLVKLQLPSSVPSIVTGAKTSSGLAVIGTIVGEFLVGYDASEMFGLGYLVQQSSDQMKTDLLFCAILLSTLLGLLVFLTVSGVGMLLGRWSDGSA